VIFVFLEPSKTTEFYKEAYKSFEGEISIPETALQRISFASSPKGYDVTHMQNSLFSSLALK